MLGELKPKGPKGHDPEIPNTREIPRPFVGYEPCKMRTFEFKTRIVNGRDLYCEIQMQYNLNFEENSSTERKAVPIDRFSGRPVFRSTG
jgi:hypothetical protein